MRNKKINIFIIAGEVSGDALGARIMRQMKTTANFTGIGGSEMTACGLKSIFPMSDLSVMGVIEVLAHARTLSRRINDTVRAILDIKPDLILTIDSPGFARSVISKLRKDSEGRKLISNGLRFYHVVAPQVWAWRPGRAKKYAKTFDKLYAFFDFEVPYFTKYGLNTIAVGHPIAETVSENLKVDSTSSDKVITIVPGSRMNEVKRLMPMFQSVVETISSCGYIGYRFAIPIVETTAEYVKNEIKNWSVQPELVPAHKRYDLYQHTYVAIVASGTVSAELAMLHVPAIVTYKMNAITTWLLKHAIRVKWVSLVNILLNRGVYPECLGPAATADNIINIFDRIILPSNRTQMINNLKLADNMWMRSSGAPSKIIADDILKDISDR
ncbi:MAG: lipid-A-disaccharide synthase [Alphaproteobacteria bacterium]|nr:lipid-A-disaccharide synthase [Alphaproteobacteria bacterium]